MFTVKVKNKLNEVYYLTQSTDRYVVTEILGLTPPNVNLSISVIHGNDGESLTYSRIEKRNIVISIRLRGNIEENRQRLYRIFPLKSECVVYFKNKNRDVKISAYVESIECNIFSVKEQSQVSLICPDPYFQSVNDTAEVFAESTAGFEFPFSISSAGIEFSGINAKSQVTVLAGDTATGGIIEFYAEGTAVNPKITNLTNGQYFGVNTELETGDKLVIDTNTGSKTVTLYHNGTETNLLSQRISGSKWIVFESGENALSYSADSGYSNLRVTVSSNIKYIGV